MSAPAPPGAPAHARVRPERRTRADVVVAALIAVAVLVAGAVVWRVSPAANTVDAPAAAPVAAPPAASGIPTGLTEAWRAPSGATDAPVVAGSAVVTGDGGVVAGHDPVTGAVAWSYRRDTPLCTVATGFPDATGGQRLLALFRNGDGSWCSELTALHPSVGTRAETSNPDVRPGGHLLAAGPYVVATGENYLEVWRSDLVRTLQYGAVTTPAQIGKQPRPGCAYGSTALASDRVGVIERCPGAATDRLTVLTADGTDGADTPQTKFSVELPDAGAATLVALTADRAAVAVAGRLLVLDGTGATLASLPLDGPVAAAPSAGAPAAVTADAQRVYWWTGSAVVALDATDLSPVWTLPGALGPPVEYGGGLLVPVAAGLGVLDAATGTATATIPVGRTDPTAPVRLATAGEMLLEQRGDEVVALRPS